MAKAVCVATQRNYRDECPQYELHCAVNKRALYPLVDDKYETKRLAHEYDASAPKLYGLIRYQHQLKELDTMLKPHQQFVMKPSQGSAGKGILVITSSLSDLACE